MKIHVWLLACGLALLLGACKGEEKAPEEANELAVPTTPEEGANLLPGWDKKVPHFAVEQDFSPKKEASIKVPSIVRKQLDGGKAIETTAWQDGNGDNYFGIFLQKDKEKDQTQLLAFHAADLGRARYRVLRRLEDFVEECEFDLVLDMIPGSLTVTDLDSNRYGEVTFVYQLGCVSDVSPLTAKLMLWENGKKYAIRGETSIKTGGKPMGGEKQPSSNFAEAPQALQTYAQMQWDRFTDTTVYYWK